MTMTVEVELTDEMIVKYLKESREGLTRDLNDRKNDRISCGIFEYDKKEDIKAIKKLIKALDKVIWYHSVEGVDYD